MLKYSIYSTLNHAIIFMSAQFDNFRGGRNLSLSIIPIMYSKYYI